MDPATWIRRPRPGGGIHQRDRTRLPRPQTAFAWVYGCDEGEALGVFEHGLAAGAAGELDAAVVDAVVGVTPHPADRLTVSCAAVRHRRPQIHDTPPNRPTSARVNWIAEQLVTLRPARPPAETVDSSTRASRPSSRGS